MTRSIKYRPFVMLLCSLASLMLLSLGATAQDKSQPGRYDFYLLNLSWSFDFCSIQGTSTHCTPPAGFVVHGLWPQNNDGTWPAFCADRPGPALPKKNLDITPDLSLLQHEWDKHGTCTVLTPTRFFALEHRALRAISIPPLFRSLDRAITLTPSDVVEQFEKANPSYPSGSIVVSCKQNRLTAVEVCLSKDTLKPLACRNIQPCSADSIQILPGKDK
jgi:ribonuclease T2